MKPAELILWLGGLIIVFVMGFWLGILLKEHKLVTIEKNITVPCEPCVVVQCPVCVMCPAEKIIEREINIPCPECKCQCTTHGAWANNRTGWWYDEYRPENNGTWEETP